MKALLVVDIQNDFLPGGALPVPGGDQIVPIINQVQSLFPLVVACKDWHPPGHCSFASSHGLPVGSEVSVAGRLQRLWPDHCIQQSWGAEFSPLLQTEKIEKVFFKGSDPKIDSYSAFFDNAHLRATGLYAFLKEKQVDTLYIAGVATDYCVLYSALDARQLGFGVYILVDGCAGINQASQDVEEALQKMRKAGVRFTHSSSLL